MSTGFYDEDDEYAVSPDFNTVIMTAQYNELVAYEKEREKLRDRERELYEASQPKARTLMQIAGMRSQRELDAELAAKQQREEDQSAQREKAIKAEEQNRLVSRFPPPILRR